VTSALDAAERALAAASGDEVEAFVQAERSGFARFAASEVHQPTLIEDTIVQLRVVRDGKSGWAATNRVSDEGLDSVARRAEAAAGSAPADPSFPGLAPRAPLPEVDGFDEETAALGADEQARLAQQAIDAAGDLELYGYFTSGVTELAVASSAGVRAHQRLTDSTALVLAAMDGVSGYADASAWAVSRLDPALVAQEAVEKARRTRSAGTPEPGVYRAVLEPYALAELLDYFAFDAFNGLALLEERSFLSGRLGERVVDEKVSIADDAVDPAGLPKAFDFEGTPKERVRLLENGVAEGVVWDRTTAARAGDGRTSTGHAPPVSFRAYGPFPFALSIAPGTAESTRELAELVGDGIYITRLHYLSVVEPREGVITGMTRDGTFRISNGAISEPLVNLRFTVSVPQVLADVPGLTRDAKLVNRSDFYGERYPVGVLSPALATTRFTITGVGSSPGL
jgi:predicted Zn-dependent protease